MPSESKLWTATDGLLHFALSMIPGRLSLPLLSILTYKFHSAMIKANYCCAAAANPVVGKRFRQETSGARVYARVSKHLWIHAIASATVFDSPAHPRFLRRRFDCHTTALV